MTWEQVERTMTFMLERQAQFDVDLAKLAAAQVETDAGLKTLRELVASNTSIYQRLADNQAALGEALLTMRDAQVRSDERMNALGIMFERFINRNDQN